MNRLKENYYHALNTYEVLSDAIECGTETPQEMRQLEDAVDNLTTAENALMAWSVRQAARVATVEQRGSLGNMLKAVIDGTLIGARYRTRMIETALRLKD